MVRIPPYAAALLLPLLHTVEGRYRRFSGHQRWKSVNEDPMMTADHHAPSFYWMLGRPRKNVASREAKPVSPPIPAHYLPASTSELPQNCQCLLWRALLCHGRDGAGTMTSIQIVSLAHGNLVTSATPLREDRGLLFWPCWQDGSRILMGKRQTGAVSIRSQGHFWPIDLSAAVVVAVAKRQCPYGSFFASRQQCPGYSARERFIEVKRPRRTMEGTDISRSQRSLTSAKLILS